MSPGSNPASEPVARGTLLDHRFCITAPLGGGQMAELFAAHDIVLNRSVALKILPPAAAANPGWRRAFENEARLLRGLEHPNVCRLYELCDIGGRPCIVLELVWGESLAQRLKRLGPLPVADGLAIAHQLCAGLAYVHARGILHRDLKPENVLLQWSPPPGGGLPAGPSQSPAAPGSSRTIAGVKLTDFGMATRVGDEDPVGPRAGTPQYMAPEQLAGRGATVGSDLYAVGLVLYELFTGRPAYVAATQREYLELKEKSRPVSPGAVVHGLPGPLEEVIVRCLAVEPASRYGSVEDVAEALHQAERGR